MNQSLYFPQPTYKDRRGWLIAFGVVEILIACFLAMMAAFIVFAMSSASRMPQQPPMPAPSMIPAIGFYLALAAGFVTLGIGSIRAREWARIAMIVVSSIWIAFGVLGILFVAVLMPTIIRQQQQSQPHQLPEGFQATFMTIVIAIQAIFMVVLPLVFLLFYCSKSVKATCQGISAPGTLPGVVPGTVPGIAPVVPAARRWPVPVVILIVWFALGTFSLIWAASITQVVAIFGFFVRGVAAHALYGLCALLYGYCAWAFYKLRKEGWWIAVGNSVFWTASTAVSMIVLGPARIMRESYQQMKIDPQQLNIFPPQFMTWVMVLSTVVGAAFIALIIYCKPYFGARAPVTAEHP